MCFLGTNTTDRARRRNQSGPDWDGDSVSWRDGMVVSVVTSQLQGPWCDPELGLLSTIFCPCEFHPKFSGFLPRPMYLPFSILGIGSESNSTLARIKHLLKMKEF